MNTLMMNDRDRKDRMIRALVEEMEELHRLQSNLPMIKLDEPYQRGWKRLYFLTELSLTRSDKHILENILTHMNHVVISNRADFLRKKGKSRKMVEIEQPLRCISLCYWNQQNLPEEWKKYFRFNDKSCWKNFWYYEFTRPSLYELRVIPHWITHVKMMDPSINRRLDEIHNHMRTHQLRNRYNNLRGYSCGRRWLNRDARAWDLFKEAKKEIQKECERFAENHREEFNSYE